MSHPKYLTTVYASDVPSDIYRIVRKAAQTAGFEQIGKIESDLQSKLVIGNGQIHVSSQLENTELHQRKVEISIGESAPPERWGSDEAYRDFIDNFVEFLCQLAIRLDTEYVALFEHVHWNDVVPSDVPLAENIDRIPSIAIYSESLLDELGGLDAIRDRPPWRVGDLENGSTLVIWDDEPWSRSGWTESSHRDLRAPQREAEPDDTDGASDSDQKLQLSDPFATLSTGAHGVDACVHRDDIAAEFRNEDLQLVRVYVDENRDLRRVDDDTFVRNVVDADLVDDEAVIQAQLADIPVDASDDDLMVSALIHGAIPPSFVRLDDPDGETVVSRVLELDVETNKVNLLISLGRAAQHDEGMDPATIEGALASLADLEAVDGIEGWIEENLL